MFILHLEIIIVLLCWVKHHIIKIKLIFFINFNETHTEHYYGCHRSRQRNAENCKIQSREVDHTETAFPLRLCFSREHRAQPQPSRETGEFWL